MIVYSPASQATEGIVESKAVIADLSISLLSVTNEEKRSPHTQ